jgi:hypothetical protein
MTEQDRGHYSKKHPEDKKIDPVIAKAVADRAKDKKITCAAAFKIADTCGAAPAEVGFTIDRLEISIVRCQMGIFGYEPENKAVKPMDNVPEALGKAIRTKLNKDNRLTCASAWEIAKALNMPKMHISSACEAMGIKIKPCQLGAF